LFDGAKWRIFGDFLRPVFFSEPRAARFKPASKIRTKATPCVQLWQTSNLRRLRLGEEKKRKLETVSIAEPLQNRQHAQNP